MTLGAAGPTRAAASITPTPSSSCTLGNGTSHVIQITFDNVHFFRDNPNVQSDLEQMPTLLNFIKSNGTMLSNNHTPLIAHTAADSLTNYTGLYGDRQGVGISNSYNTFNNNAAKNTDPATAFTYWTDPIDNTASTPSAGHDTNPNQVYSATVPATSTPPNTVAPAPWVPYTRAGCDVGDFSTANMVLENASYDIPTVFGPGPEATQTANDSNSFKNNEVTDYVGVAVHCAKDKGGTPDSYCSTAMATKEGQASPSTTAIADQLNQEPGGYTGYQALFGARYVAPQIISGAVTGTDGSGNKVHTANGHTYVVANSSNALVDLGGNQINGAFTSPARPGFPGFSPTATQSLAYLADMQESGIPVTYGYISDIHEQKSGQTGCGKTKQLGPGDPCYNANAAAYDAAFATFFQRLADDGITPQNSLFVFTADEGDHLNGANVGRAVQPTCNTGVTPTTCTYAANTLGELNVDLPKLYNFEKGNTTPFSVEPQAGAVYVTGQPGPNDPAARQLERDGATLTANNPYSGNSSEVIANYLADPTEEQLLHYVNADPARTPTFTIFPKPDYYFGGNSSCTTAASCVTINASFLWNHGYYAPEIDTTWLGLVGPGVATKGLDGYDAPNGPNSAGPNSGNGTVNSSSGAAGTWADHTDIRPTMLSLLGLKDDYIGDGRVLTEDLTSVPATAQGPSFQALATCYKQLNASVGRFGTDTLLASTTAMKTGSSADDSAYTGFQSTLAALGTSRDTLATQIKNDLFAAEFTNTALPNAPAQTAQCNAVLASADALAGPATNVPEAPLLPLLPIVGLTGLAAVAARRFRGRRSAAA